VPRSLHHRLSGTTANLPVIVTYGDALRATFRTRTGDHLRGEGRLINNALIHINVGYSQVVHKAREFHSGHLAKVESDGFVPESARRNVVIESYEDVISNLYEGGRGVEGEIPWRRFPLNSGPKVIKGADDGPDGNKGKHGVSFSVADHSSEQHEEENVKGFHPAPIEEAIGKSRFIKQAVVCGVDRPYNVALVVPDWVAIRIELGMPDDFISEEDLAKSDGVKEFIEGEIKRNCFKIKKIAIPAAFAFVDPFTAENGMITPEKSIRRDLVIESYEGLISDLYERGRGEKGEIRWRYFPLNSGPKVVKVMDETIAPPPNGEARQFHRGNLSESHSDGRVSTTDRPGEHYTLEDGTYVRPAPIEEAIGKSRFIKQAVVCGAGRPYNVALVVPDWVAIRIELGMPDDFISEEELANSDGVKELIGAEIKRNCYSIEKTMVPTAFTFVAPFTD